MGWNNPDLTWREFERRLSWGNRAPEDPAAEPVRPRSRRPPLPAVRPGGWAELHCHSSYSFLDGASDPAALVAEAARLGVEAIAVTDHDGMYGAVRLKEAAAGTGVGTIFGAELGLDRPVRQGEPD